MKYVMIILCALCALSPAQAQEKAYDDFAKIPILHDGRIKPLDSFARHYLEILSGQQRYQGKPAIEWLARTVFDPGQAVDDPLFRIRHPAALGLETDKPFLSYRAVRGALDQKREIIQELLAGGPDQWNAEQRALITYHNHALIYTALLRSLSALLPLAIDPPAGSGIDTRNPTYMDVRTHIPALEKKVQDLVARRGDNPEHYTAKERALVEFTYQISLLGRGGEGSALFKVLPTETSEWVSPWMAATDNPHLDSWQILARAWHQGDHSTWNQTVRQLYAKQNKAKIQAEVFYNTLHPLGLAMALYLVAFFSASLFAVFHKSFMKRAAARCLIIALGVHSLAIGLRIFILERPPVGTLYESILFVALIAALGGLLFERSARNANGLFAAGLSGGLLLFVAESFATEDTMKTLVAVLNTNFWLATHVLCITIGYAWCLLSALFAHLYLAGRALRQQTTQSELIQTTTALSLIALLFTATGTILGGIWADQSWGRFWGWDPKENGALLIVLWLAWCLHGRIAGQIGKDVFMALMAGLAIIVALAWFGVNLLNTGLHSYGFIEGVALALLVFCTADIVLIASLWYAAYKTETRCASPTKT